MDTNTLEILKDEPQKQLESQESELIIVPEQLPNNILVVDFLSDLRGHCKNYASLNERKTRDPEHYEVPSKEHPNWELIACHFRNTKYTPVTVRNPKALKDSFKFLVSQYLTLVSDLLNSTEKRNQLIHFIYDRMIAVRCQFHVQGLMDPKINLQIIKILIFLETLGNVPVRIVGLEAFLLPHIKKQLLQSEEGANIFKQALEMAIVKASKLQLLEILSSHSQEILQNDHLIKVLASKRKILMGSYRQYFKELSSNKNIVVRLIYWNQYQRMRDIAVAAYKKSKMNERASVLCKILCYQKMEGWVNISQPEEWEKLQTYQVEYDLKVKLWVGQKNLITGLQRLIDANMNNEQ